MKSILFGLVALAILGYVYAQVELNANFTISVTGSFRHDIPGFACTDCDCGDPCSVWVDDFTCPDAGESSFGADDNQQRWGVSASDPPLCFPKSGIGFQGFQNVQMTANAAESVAIGRMTHYNNVISPPSPTKLQLYLEVSAPELTDNFETIFPMSFIETTNRASVSVCDPSIQRFNTPCDDRFSFDAYAITESFVAPNNIRYTLQIIGFLQPTISDIPLKNFVTQESRVTRAVVFAKIVTFCEQKDCRPNEAFAGPPTCDCECLLLNKTCRAIWPRSAVDEDLCQCTCAETSESLGCNATNPAIGAFNEESCSCGCELTTAICKAQNNKYEVSLGATPCSCVCNRQAFLDCRVTNAFFVPTGEDCECVCGVTDEICQNLLGDNYKADEEKCGCIVPGSDTGLTDGEIAGIVVATVVGPLLLIGLVILIAAVLAYLIMAGYIPGIYGYKIAQGSFASGGNSSLYADPWQNNSNATA